MEDIRSTPAFRNLFLDSPEETPVPEEIPGVEEPTPVLAEPTRTLPQQTFAMKFFLLSVGAITWTAVITAILVVCFFVTIVIMAIFHSM